MRDRPPRRIDSKQLDNGLTMEIWDHSRQVAADRWLLRLVACMQIEVSQRWFGDDLPLPADLDRLRAKLGPSRRFEYRTERNFVDRQDKAAVFEQMLNRLLAKQRYYSHPEFAARFLIKTYNDRKHIVDPA